MAILIKKNVIEKVLIQNRFKAESVFVGDS